MTTCKLLELQEYLVKALTLSNNDMTELVSVLVSALEIVDGEVAEMVSSDDEKSELDAFYKED